MRHGGIEVNGVAFRQLVSVRADPQFQPAGQNVQEFDARVFVEPAVFRRRSVRTRRSRNSARGWGPGSPGSRSSRPPCRRPANPENAAGPSLRTISSTGRGSGLKKYSRPTLNTMAMRNSVGSVGCITSRSSFESSAGESPVCLPNSTSPMLLRSRSRRSLLADRVLVETRGDRFRCHAGKSFSSQCRFRLGFFPLQESQLPAILYSKTYFP